MSRLRVAGALGAVAATLVAVPAADARPAADASKKRPTITISGSTSVAPLAVKLIKGYLRTYPRRVKFKLAQGGSDVGIADAAASRVSIGLSSRDAKPSEQGGIVFNKIARDAICLTTASGNTLPNLSEAQVQAIFSGRTRNWSDVPGATATGSINLIVRTAASGTQDAFQKLFMGTARVAAFASAKASNGLVAASVKSDPSAIGYLSYAFTEGLHSVGFQGVECSLRTAKAGQYPGSRNFWAVTRGAPTRATARFLRWTQGRRGQKIVATEWVPLS